MFQYLALDFVLFKNDYISCLEEINCAISFSYNENSQIRRLTSIRNSHGLASIK